MFKLYPVVPSPDRRINAPPSPNIDEMIGRRLGRDSSAGVDCAINRLWRNGRMLYAPALWRSNNGLFPGGVMARLYQAVLVTALLTLALPTPAPVAETPAGPVPAGSPTLSKVRARGLVRCGVMKQTGLAALSAEGRPHGFQIDQCRALAAAVLQDGEAFEAIPVTLSARFDALRDGSLDVSLASITWTLTREVTLGLAFTTVTFYDGQGFLVRKADGITSLSDMKGKSICAINGTTNMGTLRDYDSANGMGFTIQAFNVMGGAWSAFHIRQCDAITADRGDFHRYLVTVTTNKDDFVILPEIISREPLAPMVRADDQIWLQIVRWVLNALVLAEEKGVTRATADHRDHADLETRRLLGLEPGIGAVLGLDDGWAARAIGAVGNYGELFERTLGRQSAVGMDRGLNRLWRDGGLLYAPALR